MRKVLCFIFFFAFLSIAPFAVHAATLSLSPSFGTYEVGKTFSLSAYVNASDQAINAVSGVISFPVDQLEIVSISKAGSIFSLWPADPSFSNAKGTVSFEGIVLNPGYKGSGGSLLTVSFRVKRSGSADISFSSASVLANDGAGTNVLNGFGVAHVTLQGTESVDPPKDPVEIKKASIDDAVNPKALTISSQTHPDQNGWYAERSPMFSWRLPAGALEVRTAIGVSSNIQPSVSYIPPISSKKVDELPDGVFYFAVQVRTATGWSPVSRYRVQIDIEGPQPFSVEVSQKDSEWHAQTMATFYATDTGSGILRYELYVDESETPFAEVSATSSHSFAIPHQASGTHALLVRAVDQTGNARIATTTFQTTSVLMPSFEIDAKAIAKGTLRVYGTTYSNADLVFTVRKNSAVILEFEAQSDANGRFAEEKTHYLEPGTYELTVRLHEVSTGAESEETSPTRFEVASQQKEAETNFEWQGMIANALMWIIIIVCFALMVFIVWLGIPHLVTHARRKMRSSRLPLRSLRILYRDVAQYAVHLRSMKRNLTAEEKSLLHTFDRLFSDQDVERSSRVSKTRKNE